MGAGASFETANNTHEEFFCHSCRRAFGISNPLVANTICPFCSSSCIEEFGSFDPYLSRATARNISDEQTSRLNNAAFMLRILEHQLRSELENIQATIASSEVSISKAKVLAKAALYTVKDVVVDANMCCSQPSCPICSEDYTVGELLIQLPCTHAYHRKCVTGWLETKKTCPVCRFNVSDKIPTAKELAELSVAELSSSLSGLGITFDEYNSRLTFLMTF